MVGAMKKNISFRLAGVYSLLFLLGLGSPASAEPLAPLAPLAPLSKYSKEGLTALELNKDMTLEDVRKTIPAKERVGIPVYPGATFASAFGGAEGFESIPPFVNLISNDPLEKVKAWYGKNLPGWKYDDKWLQVFHDGPEGARVEDLDSGKYQLVSVEEEYGGGLDLMYMDEPDIKTRIVIHYKPK
jgi:hypothetical protein